MHTSPRQLISGKLGWGWTKAVHLIASNALFTSCFIAIGTFVPILRTENNTLVALTLLAMVAVFVLARFIARSILTDCRQNLSLNFPAGLQVAIAFFWLVLVALLSLKVDRTLKDGFIASFWAIAASAFLGISVWLGLVQTRPAAQQEGAAADRLSTIVYSDKTVSVSPTSLAQQPRQSNSTILLLMGLWFWTAIDLPARIEEIMTIALVSAGLTGISTWQLQMYPAQNLLRLHFSGLWGLAATYTINLRSFSRLEIVKLREGELTWLQLSGYGYDITLPAAILGNFAKDGEANELEKTLSETCHLARHETSRDSLGMMGVLLPQGAGILTGIAALGLSIAIALLLPLPQDASLEGAIILVGTCLVSPTLAKCTLNLVAPNLLRPDPAVNSSLADSWEIGIALISTAILLSDRAALIAILCSTWLSFCVGACILALIRRAPVRIET